MLRRLIIRWLLPLVFVMPILLLGPLVVSFIPERAIAVYVDNLPVSRLDWLILSVGVPIYLTQIVLAWRALEWQGQDFNHRPDAWLLRCYQTAEWFPLLGLLGTVTAILQTFSTVGAQENVPTREIIRLYAPALTTTGSGLAMTFLNLVPNWVVAMGRNLIQRLALEGGRSHED
ncbi:MAG: hypothetical protein C4297_02910 [Gemmataceae bacterium]